MTSIETHANSHEALLIDATEVARILHVSTRTVWRLVSKGEIVEPIRFGGTTRWRRQEIAEWVEAGCPTPHTEKKK